MKKLTAFILAVLMIASMFALTVPTSAWTFRGSNTSDLIFKDTEYAVNAGKLPEASKLSDGAITINESTPDEDWKYAYPFKLDKTYMAGRINGAINIDMYFMWDNANIYIREVRRDTPNAANTTSFVYNGAYDYSMYQILVPKIDLTSEKKPVGISMYVSTKLAESGEVGEVIDNSVDPRIMKFSYTTSSSSVDTSTDFSGYTSYSRRTSIGYDVETIIPWTSIGVDPSELSTEYVLGIMMYPSDNAKYGTHTINDGGVNSGSSIASHGSWDGHAPLCLRDTNENASEYLVDVSWYNTTDTTFEISTPGQLMGLSALINNYKEVPKELYGTAATSPDAITAGKTFVITNDIDLNPGWNVGDSTPPLYVWQDLYVFSGKLDGQGHTISGVYCDKDLGVEKTAYKITENRNRGFISNALGTVTIENIAFDNMRVEGNYNTAALMATAGGTITNVSVSTVTLNVNNVYIDADIDADVSGNNWSYAGVVIGKPAASAENWATITNVVCMGSLKYTVASDQKGAGCAPIWGGNEPSGSAIINNVLVVVDITTTASTNNISNTGSRTTTNSVRMDTDGSVIKLEGCSTVPTDWVTYDQAGTYEMPASVAEMVYGKVLAQVSEETYDNGTTFKVRIIDVVNSDEWASLGVNIDVYVDGTLVETFPADADTTVFTSINAAGKIVNATDADIDAKYIHMEVVSGLPTTGTVEIVVTPVKTLGTSTVTNARSYTFTFVNGEAVQ